MRPPEIRTVVEVDTRGPVPHTGDKIGPSQRSAALDITDHKYRPHTLLL